VGTEANKAIVRRFIDEVFNEGKLAAIAEVVDRGYIMHGTTPEVRGQQGMQEFVTTYRTALPDYHCTIEDQVAEGDKVVTRWTVRGTQRGELDGIPPTGKPVTLAGIVIDRIANGRMAETWQQADVLGMMQQLGLIPAPAAGGAARS
jgi:steroid delta-isomerase-like uncharacterized protein